MCPIEKRVRSDRMAKIIRMQRSFLFFIKSAAKIRQEPNQKKNKNKKIQTNKCIDICMQIYIYIFHTCIHFLFMYVTQSIEIQKQKIGTNVKKFI